MVNFIITGINIQAKTIHLVWIYLDPNHTGKTQLAGRYATAPKAMPTDLTSVYQNGEVLLK